MSPPSGKIPENLATKTSTPFGESLVPPISHFVFRFRESSKKFVLEILTKNFAFNLSGSLFLVGLGCSLKWWYKDQLLVALLKQNLPALSEPQQKISWETGEYIIKEQNRQFAEKRGIIDSPLKRTVDKNTFLNLSSFELPSFLGDYSSSAVPEGKQALWGTELLGSSNDLNTVHFPNPYPKQLEASELPYSDHKVFQGSLNNPSNFANKTFDRLIERIDLYANHVVVKFKSPWEKHAYQRFVGVFSEPTQITKFKFVLAVPSGASPLDGTVDAVNTKAAEPIVPSKHIKTNFTSNSPKNSGPLEGKDQQSPKGESKVNKSSDSLEKRLFVTSDSIEKPLLFPAVSKVKETPDPKKVWSNKNVVSLAQPMKVNSALQERNNFYSKDRFGKIGNIREKFPKYTLWKPLYPAHWFKLSARGLCILNKDKNLWTSFARSINQVSDNSFQSLTFGQRKGKESPESKFTLGAGFPFIFLQPTPMFPRGNEGVWSCFGNSAVNFLNLLQPCSNFTNREDSHFRQSWPLTFGDNVSTGLTRTKTQQEKTHKHVGFSAFTPSGIIDRVNNSADVALRSVVLNTRLVELRARVGALNALTVNHKRWNFDGENALTPSIVQSVKKMEIGDKGLNPIEVQASYSYGLGKLKALGASPLHGTVDEVNTKEGEGQRTCSRIDSLPLRGTKSASGIAQGQNLGFSPKGTANGIANLSIAKPIESTRLGKLSYPLELTTTLAGWQPPIDTLVLNSYLDEIPYKLENTLLVPPWKKNSELLKPSALSAHLMAPSVIEQNSPTSFNDQVSTPLTQLKKAGTVTGSPLKGKALGVEKTSSLMSAQGDKTPTLDERPFEKALELVERKVATKPIGFSPEGTANSATRDLKRTAHQSDLSHVSTQPAHMVYSDQVRTKARSETFFKKLQLVEIKHLLKNELQSLANTLSLTFVDMPQNPASLVSIDSVNKPIDGTRRGRNDVSSKKGLKPENLRINGDQMENSGPLNGTIDKVNRKDQHSPNGLAFPLGLQSKVNKSVDCIDSVNSASEILQNSLSLLNNLGVTFNNLSSLTTPPVLLPITSDASFWAWNPSVHMPYGAQAKLNSGLLTHWQSFLGESQSRVLKTRILGGGGWAKKPENSKVNASQSLTFPQGDSQRKVSMAVPSHATFPRGGPGKPLTANDTIFYFDPNNLTWEILQQPSYNQHFLSSFSKGVQNNLKTKIVTRQEKRINKIVLKQRKITIDKVENINSVDKGINFTNRKSRFMSGYVYPDMQNHSLKANLYRWIPLTKNSLATPQRDIPVTAIPQSGCFPIGSANSATADNTFYHSVQLINANRQSPSGQSISRNVLDAHDSSQFERHKNKTLAFPLSLTEGQRLGLSIDFVNKSMGMPLQSTWKELEIYCTIDKINRLLYPNSFPGVHRFIDKVSLVGVEIPTAPTTFLSRYLQPEPLDAYQLASFPAVPKGKQAPHPLRSFRVGSPLQGKVNSAIKGKANKSVKPLGTIDGVNTLNGPEQLRDQQQTLDMVKKIDTKSAAAFPLLQKKINTISIPLQSFDYVTKGQLAQKNSRKKYGPLNGTIDKVNRKDQQFPKEESKVNNVAIDAKSNKDGVGPLNGTIDFPSVAWEGTVNRKDGIDRFINEVGERNDTTLANPMELVTKSIRLNHHLASFPGFTKPNQLFWSLNQIAQGDDITFFKNVSPHSMESSGLLAAKIDADPVGVKNQKELAKNSSWSFPSRGSGKDTTLALIGSSPKGTANETMESINLVESQSLTEGQRKGKVNKSFTPTADSGVDDGQGHKTVPTKKHFIDCSPRRTAYQGIVVQRNKLTKDFQPPKSSLEQSSAWGTICLGPENPLSNRQCHFFGQRRFSTIDTNDFQRDYLRQLGKETLAQSNYKAFTEKSTSVERAKILSFSKTVNSFFLKKRKYTYLLDEKDQWHLLFQEQLRTALEDPKKYPPLTPEEAKDHGPGRIKVSAPLMMARFPKRTAKTNGMRYLPFHWQSPSGKSQGAALTPDLIGVKELSTQSFPFRGPEYGNNAFELPSSTLTPAQLQQLSTQHIDSSLHGTVDFPLKGTVNTKVNSAFGESLDLLTQSIGTSWRPLCCLRSSQLFTPQVGSPFRESIDSSLNNTIDSHWLSPKGTANETLKETVNSAIKGAGIVEKVNKGDFHLPEIVSHYPLFTEKDRLELHYAPSLNKSSLPIFHAANNLQWLTQEPLTVVSWAILSQWSFLVALLLWTEQMLLANVFPALSALEQLLLGATGIKSGDRTHVIRISQGDTPKFKDIAGVDGLLGELAELVLFLRGHRERLWNKKSSYGVLLTGPPGTGKTFLVRALANEARVPVLILSAGTLTVNKINSNKPSWAIRHAFRRAKQLAPCILFIDEIDALGQSRGKIVTDINEIVADTNSGSPGLKNCQKQTVSSTSTFPDEVLAYEQLQQNWPSVSKSLINEWQSSLKSTVLQESNNINRSSLCENEMLDLWKSYGNYSEASTNPGTYNYNAGHPQGVRASDVELNANKTQPGQSFRGNANNAAQRENIKRKFGPLTQLLVSMDGVSNLSGVLIMGATNRPESLDPALTRPGRFERVIQVEKPAEQKRVEILQLYSHNLGVKHKIPWSYLANRTVGLTAADLAVAMNYSSLKAIVQGSMHTIETIEYGLDSISRSLNKSPLGESIDSPLQGLRSRVNSASIKNNLDRQSPLGLASPSGLLAKQHSVSAGSEFLKPHEIRRLDRLTQMAYYQAGKVVVQTLLPQHPPVALITLNLSGITTATSADTHIPVDGAFGTQWCSSLESRLIGLYGGKAASFLLECQQALAYPKPSQLLTKTPRKSAGSEGSKSVPPIQSLASPVDSKTQLSNTPGKSGVRERGLRDLNESVHNFTNQPFETQFADAPLVSWTDRTKLDSFSNDFGLSNQKGVRQTLSIRGVSEQKCASARTGFQSDIGNLEVQSATRLATAMINKWAFYSLQSSNVIREKNQETGCLPPGSNNALSINSGFLKVSMAVPFRGKPLTDCVNRGIDSLTSQQFHRKNKPPYGFLPELRSGQQLTMDYSSNVAISYPKGVKKAKFVIPFMALLTQSTRKPSGSYFANKYWTRPCQSQWNRFGFVKGNYISPGTNEMGDENANTVCNQKNLVSESTSRYFVVPFRGKKRANTRKRSDLLETKFLENSAHTLATKTSPELRYSYYKVFGKSLTRFIGCPLAWSSCSTVLTPKVNFAKKDTIFTPTGLASPSGLLAVDTFLCPKRAVGTKVLLMNKVRKVGKDNSLWQNSIDSPLKGKVNNAFLVPSLESYLRFLNLSESDTTHVSSNELSKQPSGESLGNDTRETSISNNEGQFRKIHVANTPSGKKAQSYYPYGAREAGSQWVSNFPFDQQSSKGESKVDNASSWKDKFASSKNVTRADSNEQQMPKISQMALIANDNLAENDLRFAISQSRSFLQRGGQQRSSYNDSRISIQDVGERVFSRAEVLKLVNQFQLSNVQRDRFYPGWFRLYLPDIEATEFLKNVANYYFSLGLQTLTRPSLSEFTQHHWLSPKGDCQYFPSVAWEGAVNLSIDSLPLRGINSACKSLEEDDHMGNSLHSLELPLNEKNSVYIDTKLSAEPIDDVNTAEIPIGSPLRGKAKVSSSTSVFDSDKNFVKDTIDEVNTKRSNEIDLFQLHETSFCGIFDSSNYVQKSSLNVQNDKEGNETTSWKSRENLQHTSVLSSYFIASQKRRDAIVDQVPVGGKTRSIALRSFPLKGTANESIKNVFFCCGGNNLSIGVGLLRSAANRRTQLNVKSQHFSKPRQISKKIYYPNVSMALWGFSRPWNMNRLINIGFRQDAILPPKGDNNVYNETVVKKNSSAKEHNSKLCYSSLDLLFDRMNKKMNGLVTQSVPLGTIDSQWPKANETLKGTVNRNWNQNQNDNKSRDSLAYDNVKQGKKETNQLAQLDVSLFLSLEKQIFPVGYNDVSVVEKEFLYHALVNNCYAKAFFLVDENRQLIDYFADYLIRFQILRQHQIFYLFSTVLLSCKKQP